MRDHFTMQTHQPRSGVIPFAQCVSTGGWGPVAGVEGIGLAFQAAERRHFQAPIFKQTYNVLANTYGQAYIHIVFAVKYRNALLHKPWRQEVFGYMGGIINNMGLKVMIINGVEDHVHMLVGMKPDVSISDICQKVKANSSK